MDGSKTKILLAFQVFVLCLEMYFDNLFSIIFYKYLKENIMTMKTESKNHFSLIVQFLYNF